MDPNGGWVVLAAVVSCCAAYMVRWTRGLHRPTNQPPLPPTQHNQPAIKSQMDAFWTVYAEKPTLVGAAVVAIAFLEVISGVATTEGRQNGDRQVRTWISRSDWVGLGLGGSGLGCRGWGTGGFVCRGGLGWGVSHSRLIDRLTVYTVGRLPTGQPHC